MEMQRISGGRLKSLKMACKRLKKLLNILRTKLIIENNHKSKIHTWVTIDGRKKLRITIRI